VCYSIETVKSVLAPVFFLVIAVSHAFPEQANKPKPNHSDAKNVVGQTQKPITKTPAVQPTPTPKQSSADSETKQSGWCERLLAPLLAPVISNWPLLAVAIWGILVAKSTFKAINRQADLAAAQIGHLINSERAWIQVPEIIMFQILSGYTPAPTIPFIWFRPYIVNNGKTQARITKITGRADVLEKTDNSVGERPPPLPEQPPPLPTLIERNIILSPEQGINWITIPVERDHLEPIRQRKAFLYIYGRIDYVDMSETARHTGFCKIYWIPYGPSDPNFGMENFIDSAVIPPAYTECT